MSIEVATGLRGGMTIEMRRKTGEKYGLPKGFRIYGGGHFWKYVDNEGSPVSVAAIQIVFVTKIKDCSDRETVLIRDNILSPLKKIPRKYREKLNPYKSPFMVNLDYYGRDDSEKIVKLPPLKEWNFVYAGYSDKRFLRKDILRGKLCKQTKSPNITLWRELNGRPRWVGFLLLPQEFFRDLVKEINEIEVDKDISAQTFVDAQGTLKSLVHKAEKKRKFSRSDLDIITDIWDQKGSEDNATIEFINSHFYELIESLMIDGTIKICPGCGRIFQKPEKMSDVNWSRKVYCTQRCGKNYRSRRDYKRHCIERRIKARIEMQDTREFYRKRGIKK